MRVFYMGNNWLGWKVLEWLVEQEEVVGLAVHSEDEGTYVDELRNASGLDEERVFDGSSLRDGETTEAVRNLEPDMGVSVLFGYILQPTFLDLFSQGAVNLHPAYLPYNRGAYPNVWSIVDGTPAGVTLHRIDEDIDTGEILARRRVEVRPTDTGRSLYRRLEQAGLELFRSIWSRLVAGEIEGSPQDESAATEHRVHDVEDIDEIDLDAKYKARDLINILRARTFPPHDGAYFEAEGRRVYLRLELTEEN
jgi:methionyl-tRNA formyltransferase